jgi:NADPH2:quinone reductase
MKAAFIRETGPASHIQYGDLPDPEPGPGQARLRVEAVSVNPIDTYLRAGLIEMPLPQPYVLGCDCAGVVDAVGAEVSGLRVGDRVWCTNQGLLGRQGTFSELAVVDSDWLYPVPDGVESSAAAACALVGVTAHLGLFREADLKAGETVLVIGGSGGVGSMVVQMAKAAGARVIATAGGASKAEVCSQLGADQVIDYTRQDIGEAVAALEPEGVRIFWETRRVPDFDLAISALAERGRMILMAGRDARPEFPVGPFYVKECSLHGFVMFKATPDEMRQAADDINTWLADGRLRSQIGQTLPLAEAAAAHQLQERATLEGSGELHGKIVLTV